jgi:uncharacterized repeat protein (TIGR01451 family)
MKKLLLLVFSSLTVSVFADCPGLTVNFYMNSATCSNSCNGHGYAVASGGSGNYSYSFLSSTYTVLPDQVNDSVYNLCAGNYYLIVNDITNGCLDTNAFVITSPPALVAMTNSPVQMCSGGMATLVSTTTGGTPGYTYMWSPATGLSSVNGATTVASPPTSMTYTLTVTDANGCIFNTTATVIVNPNPNITVNSPTICAGMTAMLTATGATTYSWAPGGVVAPSIAVSPASTTTYTVTGSSGSCSSTALSTVTVNPVPVVSLTPSPTNCGACTGSITTSTLAGSTFSWTGPSGYTSTVMNPSNLCAGVYTVVANRMGCSSTNTSTTVSSSSSSLNATVGSVTAATCGMCDGSATVFVTGGTGPYTYLWSPAGITTATAGNLCAGTYIVQVTDASGCSVSVTVAISNSSSLTGSASSTSSSCNICNGTATVSASGGTGPYTYSWSDPTLQTTATATGLCQGTYTVVVTDSLGCTMSFTTNVNSTVPVYVTGNSTSSSCGVCDGTATLIATGGTPPYLYSIGGLQQTNGNFNTLCPGVYVGMVTDNNGCSGSFSFIVGSNNSGSFTVSNTIQNETGYGLQNGSINLTVSGAGAPFTFQWSNGAVTEDIYSLSAGSYNVTITDNTGNCGTYYYNITTIATFGYITGYFYNDNNGNCTYDTGDYPIQGYNVYATNGTNTYWGTSNTNGYYVIWAPVGSYTLNATNTANQATSCTNTYSLNLTGSSTLINNNFSYNLPPTYDVCVNTWTSGIVPGFNGYYNVYLSNYGNQSANGVVYIVLPGILDYVTSYPAASSVSGDTVFWNYTGLLPNGTQYFTVTFNTPVTAVLGTSLSATVNASVTNGTDINPGCNTSSYTRIITGSFDPNDKTVSPSGTGTAGDIPLTEDEFSYLIRFQNTGNGPAVNITVTDTLSSLLDPMSFQMLNASHPYVVEMLPGNVIKWHFDNIMLADSNSNEPASHGHIQFRVNKLNAPVAGQVIENKAYIYFDFNEPVITNTAINTYDVAAGIEAESSWNMNVMAYPNPFSENTTFMIRSDKANQNYVFVLTDMLGKTVAELKTNDKQFTISRNGLENGMYFYSIKDSNGSISSGKLIIK